MLKPGCFLRYIFYEIKQLLAISTHHSVSTIFILSMENTAKCFMCDI
jgi:hypothetical protein